MATGTVTVTKDTKTVSVVKDVNVATGGTDSLDTSISTVEGEAVKTVIRRGTESVLADQDIYIGPAGPTGPQGPAGDPGTEFSIYGVSPDLTYSGDEVVRVDYVAGDYKLLTYSNGLLIQVDWVRPDMVLRKVLTYSGQQLDYVTQSTLPPL